MGLACHPASRYQVMEVNGADRIELILLLYKSAIKELRQAKGFLEQRDIENRVRCINKANSLIGELKTALDFDRGGEIATSLDRLYAYMIRRTTEANLRRDGDALEEVAKLLEILLSAWEEARLKIAAEKPPERPFPSAVGNGEDRLSLSPTGYTGSTY
jgi:flagellar secretion chaperone FliS